MGGQGTGAPEESSALRIFINYRRDDSAGHAGRLHDALVARFGEEHIFMDIDRIPLGVDFVEAIRDAVGSCDVLIALIGRDWLSLPDARGRPRLENPEDYVRLELEAALSRGVPVIPARVQDAEMPSSTELPEVLAPFARRNGLPLRDIGWREDVGRLMRALEGMAEEKARRGQAGVERERAEQALRERVDQERLARERAEQEARERAEQEEREQHERQARERAEREALERPEEQMDADQLSEAYASYRRGTGISTLAARYAVDAEWLVGKLHAIDERESTREQAEADALAVEPDDVPNASSGRAVAERRVGAALVVGPVWQRLATGVT
jgi:hypothetical protein